MGELLRDQDPGDGAAVTAAAARLVQTEGDETQLVGLSDHRLRKLAGLGGVVRQRADLVGGELPQRFDDQLLLFRGFEFDQDPPSSVGFRRRPAPVPAR